MKSTAIAVALAAAACGDNIEPEPEPCVSTPAELPTSGPFADPLALPMPSNCIDGGLRDLPGRWFVRTPEALFSFGYPKYETTCDGGYRRFGWTPDDHDITDGDAFHTWSDGTVYYQRDYFLFDTPIGAYEYASVTALCMAPDGTIQGINGTFDTDRGEMLFDVIGTRFEPKDTGASGLELVGEVGAETIPAYNVAIDGNHAYVVGPLGFDVIDVTDPAAPAVIAHLKGGFNDVKVVRGAGSVVAYLSPIDEERTAIVDVTIPNTPVFVGTIGEYSHSVFVTATPPRLYLATYTSTVPVYDVTTPLIPIRLGGVPIPGTNAGIHDIHVTGDRIYADKTGDGVVAVDVSGGLTTPVTLGNLKTSYSHATWAGVAGGRPIIIHGDEGMTPDGGAFLRVLDADQTSPTFMTEIGRYQSRPDVGIHNMQLVGDRAFIAYYQDGVRVLDLSDPTKPREIAHYNTWDTETAGGGPFEGALGINVVGDRIYVADLYRGLLILRATP